MSDAQDGVIVGVDLSTAVRCAAFTDGRPSVLSARVERSETPAAVTFDGDGAALAGEPARDRASSHMDRTVTDVQRRLREDEALRVDGVAVPPEALAAAVVDRACPDGVERAVVSRPALATTRHRRAVRDACRIAGVTVERTVSHSVAASLPLSLERSDRRTVAVLALDGSSLDVSVHDVGDGVNETLGSGGDPALGTAAWDAAVVEWLADVVAEARDVDLRTDPQASHRLREAAATARAELATREQVGVELRRVATAGGDPIDVDETLDRRQYESLTAEPADRAVDAVERVLDAAGVDPTGVDEVHLVGAADEVPGIATRVEALVGDEPRGVPRTAVARGLAIQGGVLDGRIDDFVLVNVAARGVGVETAGGDATPLIRPDAAVPTEASRAFAVEADGPTSVPVRVYRFGVGDDGGELVAATRLAGVAPTDERREAVEVAAVLDGEGGVHVEAESRATGDRVAVRARAPALTGAGVTWAQWAVLGRDASRPPGVAGPVGSPSERAAHRPVDLREPRPADADRGDDVPLVPLPPAEGADAEEGATGGTDVSPGPTTHDGSLSDDHLVRLLEVDDDLSRALAAEAESPADVQAGLASTREKLSALRRSELSATVADDVAALADDLSRAVEAEPDSVERLRRWVGAARRRLAVALESAGVTRIEPVPGAEVDPERHRVVARVAVDRPRGRIVEVERAGYERGGTVERPARVVVSEGT